jgi:choice-of-anchor C domain-containing protein
MAENNVRCLYRALTIAVLAVGLPRAAQANLIANGNFSSPVLAYGATYCACSPSEANAIVDWTITVGNVDLVPGGTSADGATWEPPPGGGQSVDLDGTEPGAIAQGFDTTQGRLYTVSFYLSGNPDGPPDIKYLAVSAGNSAQTFAYAAGLNTRENMNYVLESFSFTATDCCATLRTFTSNDNPISGYGPVIGSVSVVPMPEPTPLALLCTALAGLGICRAGHHTRRRVRDLLGISTRPWIVRGPGGPNWAI